MVVLSLVFFKRVVVAHEVEGYLFSVIYRMWELKCLEAKVEISKKFHKSIKIP